MTVGIGTHSWKIPCRWVQPNRTIVLVRDVIHDPRHELVLLVLAGDQHVVIPPMRRCDHGPPLLGCHTVVHPHLHVVDDFVDLGVGQDVNAINWLIRPLLGPKHDLHGHRLHPTDECFITRGLGLRPIHQESLGTPRLTRGGH